MQYPVKVRGPQKYYKRLNMLKRQPRCFNRLLKQVHQPFQRHPS